MEAMQAQLNLTVLWGEAGEEAQMCNKETPPQPESTRHSKAMVSTNPQCTLNSA